MYRELCSDLRRQFPGYRMDVVSVVIGGLGTVTPSGGRPAPSPYCGKSHVTNQRDAALCAVFLCVNPEASPLSMRAGSLNPCGICC